jgi:hypothetical protein
VPIVDQKVISNKIPTHASFFGVKFCVTQFFIASFNFFVVEMMTQNAVFMYLFLLMFESCFERFLCRNLIL